MKEDKKRIISMLSIFCVIFLAYMLLDYINVLSLMGLQICNINMSLFPSVLNALIAVILYVITYYILDKKQIQKDNNAKETVDVLIGNSVKMCLESIKLLNDKETLTNYIVPKVNFDDINLNNQVVQNLQNQPFAILDSVMQLAVNGAVEKDRLKKYLEMMDEYKSLVSLKITFFDIENAETIKQIQMKEYIEEKELRLVAQLKKEVY